MKKSLFTIIFIAVGTALFAGPIFKGRLDVSSINVSLVPVSGPEKGYFKNINWGDNDKQKFSLTGETASLPADRWTKASFAFIPENDGRIVISLMSNWSVTQGKTARNGHWIYYDMVTAEGSVIKNGDFEEANDGKPAFWGCKPSQYVIGGIDFAFGNAAVKVCYNEPCNQTIIVKKGQQVTIKLSVRAGEFESAPDDKKNISLKSCHPVGHDWVPFAIDWTTTQPPVWNFSNYVDAPSGKYGFLQVDGPHFVTGDNRQRIRLWGTNISGPSCFPSHEDAKNVSAFLKRWGFNAVRLAHIDSSWAKGLIDYRDKTQLAFNEERFDRFFFFLAELKKNGIYYVIDGRHGFEFSTVEFKYLDSFWRRGSCLLLFSTNMQRYHEKYLRKLFLTRNPYTGLSLVDDPAMAGVQMLNETFLSTSLAKVGKIADIPVPQQTEFQEKWQTWSSLNNLVSGYDTADEISRRRFFSWLERGYFQRMKTLYRQELGMKCPIATTSCYVGAFTIPSAVDGDYTEGHVYYSHPKIEEVTFGKDKLKLVRLETDPCYVGGNYLKMLPFLLHQRIGYQPFVVGEWNNCLPERFDGPLLVATFGAIQDFDAMFMYTLAQSDWALIRSRNIGTFPSFENPSIMINMIPAALAWHGHMIPAAAEELAITVPDAMIFGTTVAKQANAAETKDFGKIMDAAGQVVEPISEKYHYEVFAENLFLFRVFNCPEVPISKILPTQVKRMTYSQRSKEIFPELQKMATARSPIVIRDNIVTVNTPQWISIWGRLGGKTVAVFPLTVTAAPDQDFSVTATALDGKSMTDSRKVLITIGTVSMARESVFLEQIDQKNGQRLARWKMSKTENDPMAKPIRASVSFKVGENWQCFRVSTSGVKEERIALSEADCITWNLDPVHPSWFFLLER
jgi:hypothetical protein